MCSNENGDICDECFCELRDESLENIQKFKRIISVIKDDLIRRAAETES